MAQVRYYIFNRIWLVTSLQARIGDAFVPIYYAIAPSSLCHLLTLALNLGISRPLIWCVGDTAAQGVQLSGGREYYQIIIS